LKLSQSAYFLANQHPGEDPGFFSEGGAPLRNGITDWWGKQSLKAYTKKRTSSQGSGGGCTSHAPSL